MSDQKCNQQTHVRAHQVCSVCGNNTDELGTCGSCGTDNEFHDGCLPGAKPQKATGGIITPVKWTSCHISKSTH